MPYHSIISNDESSVVTTAWNPIVGRDSNWHTTLRLWCAIINWLNTAWRTELNYVYYAAFHHRHSKPLTRDTRFFCVDLNVIYYVIGHSKVPIPYQD